MKTENNQAAQHTAGPWTHTALQDTIWANDGETKVATIADLPWVTNANGKRGSDWMTEQANARLMAAAPQLLAQLTEIITHLEAQAADYLAPELWPHTRERLIKAGCSAIAAAKGVQS